LYPVRDNPPVSEGAVQERFVSSRAVILLYPVEPIKFVGAPGTDWGIMRPTMLLQLLSPPMEFLAFTQK
jgi:hypothetical protein